MKKTLIVVAILFAVAVAFGLYQYFRRPVSLKNLEADIVLPATELKEQLMTDSSAAGRLGDKILLVEGTVSSVEQNEPITITIDSVVRGELEGGAPAPEPGQTVRLKGKLGGYDEMFGEVVLIKCQLVE